MSCGQARGKYAGAGQPSTQEEVAVERKRMSDTNALQREAQAVGDWKHAEAHRIEGDAQTPGSLKNSLWVLAGQGRDGLQGMCFHFVEPQRSLPALVGELDDLVGRAPCIRSPLVPLFADGGNENSEPVGEKPG